MKREPAMVGPRQSAARGQLVCCVAGLMSFCALGFGAEPPTPTRIPWKNERLFGSPAPPAPYRVTPVFTQVNWKAPMYIAQAPDRDELLVVLQGGEAERPSRIVSIHNQVDARETTTFVEMPGRMIYACAFHPDFAQNRFAYVFSNGPTPDPKRVNRISRFVVSRADPPTCDPASELAIIEWPSAGHDGGDLLFGLDRMLYIATGDGTSDSDTNNTGQDLSDLLGAVLRIDVDHPAAGKNYSVPADNPFIGIGEARPEIWAYGLRNPWRMTIDPASGDIWVGNNGQDLWETAHLVHRGDNYGWSVYEGSHPFYLQRRRGPTPVVAPTIEHSHADFRSLTGGVVYRGRQLPELDGAYIYGDYSTGKIWGARHCEGQIAWARELADTSLQIAAFGVDRLGNLLVVDHGGGLYRLEPNPPSAPTAQFPTRLSETGLFVSTAEQAPAPGVVAYAVNAPAWTDGATARRWLALPDGCQITYSSSRGWSIDDGAVVAQTWELGARRVETRILIKQQSEWAGYSYRWNAAQTDAELVPAAGADERIEGRIDGDAEQRAWRFPSRTECMTCHSRAANYVLALTESQLNRDAEPESGLTGNQLQALTGLGVFRGELPKPAVELARLENPYHSESSLEARVRSYLHVNCSSCHVAAGGGNAQMELEHLTPLESTRLIEQRPQHDTFGIDNAMLVAPGHPEHSVWRGCRAVDAVKCPPLVSNQVDEQAVSLFQQWIVTLRPKRPFVRKWNMDDLAAVLVDSVDKASIERGKIVFNELGCAQCHRRGDGGAAVGPDLTRVGTRLSRQQILEAIVAPSKSIADEYAQTMIETADGEALVGRVEREDDESLTIRSGALQSETIRLLKSQVVERRKSDVSNMPTGTIDVLQEDEILDLIAFLLSDVAHAANAGDN